MALGQWWYWAAMISGAEEQRKWDAPMAGIDSMDVLAKACAERCV